MRPQEINLVMSLCGRRAGLKVSGRKTYLMETRLAPAARWAGFASVSALLQEVRDSRDDKLIWAVVEAMTCPETRFFRDRSLFEAIETRIYPSVARARQGDPVRIWSAAVSTGQEIYSLAMTFERLQRNRRQPIVDLAASDISKVALERAQAALYSQGEVQAGLPIRLLVKYFEKEGEAWRLSPRIRRMVRWRRVNLMASLEDVGEFDIILCRNLVCDLEVSRARRVIENLASALAPGGYLILGRQDDPALAEGVYQPTGAPGIFRSRCDRDRGAEAAA